MSYKITKASVTEMLPMKSKCELSQVNNMRNEKVKKNSKLTQKNKPTNLQRIVIYVSKTYYVPVPGIYSYSYLPICI